MSEAQDPENKTAFIPAKLDEAGLSAAEFRVFARISRRGDCEEAVPNMAKRIGLHPDTIWASLSCLIKRQMITRETRPGKASVYRVTHPSGWTKPTGNEGEGKSNPPENKGRVSHRKIRGGSHPKIRGDHPPENKGHKGSPSEGSPSKVLKTPISPKGDVHLSGVETYHPDTEAVLEFLHATTRQWFTKSDKNLKPISDRLREDGVSVESVKLMIVRQAEQWDACNTVEGRRRIRPKNLFSDENFENNHAARHQPVNRDMP